MTDRTDRVMSNEIIIRLKDSMLSDLDLVRRDFYARGMTYWGRQVAALSGMLDGIFDKLQDAELESEND